MTGGCKFCGNSTDGEYCSELCEQLFYGYLHRVETFGILYVICLLVSLALFIIPVFLGHFVQFFGLGLLALGTTLSLMPFAPSFVIDRIGVRKSEKYLRISGWVMFAVGIVMSLIPFLL